MKKESVLVIIFLWQMTMMPSVYAESSLLLPSKQNFYHSFLLGVNLMPEYNDDGVNEGFRETNFFGKFQIDNREDFFYPVNWKGMKLLQTWNAGAIVEFLSENIVDCSKIDDEEEKTDCEENSKSSNDINFNDITRTINASAYLSLNLWKGESGVSELSGYWRGGMRSREKLKENGDSINRFEYAGLQYVAYDLDNDPETMTGPGDTNGVPFFRILLAVGKYEDYAGLGKREGRKIVESSFLISKKRPLYLGLNINGGEGPDEIALSLSYGFDTGKLGAFFGLDDG